MFTMFSILVECVSMLTFANEHFKKSTTEAHLNVIGLPLAVRITSGEHECLYSMTGQIEYMLK